MKTYEKLARFIELNYDSLQSCFKHHVYTRSQKKNTKNDLWIINIEKEAYIIKYIKQPSQLCAKHVNTKKHHEDNKMQCMQINKYEHKHDDGSKKEN
jgi:hypothetical protein